MSLQAYQQVQNSTEDPRRTEYRLFAQVTRALIEAAKEATPGQLARAVHWNRRLWMTLQADCAQDDNALPEQTRAGIISLSLWVDRHSRAVLKGQADIAALIQVNRSIMEGLAS